MALYRFLFAPALLAVAVLAGPRADSEPAVRADLPRVIASAPRPAVAEAPPSAAAPLERAVAAEHVARRAAPAKPAR
jgi:hypothetical protein